MKPNIFEYKSITNEDHFTLSLCYLLNLFPVDLGDRLLSKIAKMSGYPHNYFGKFVNAEFTGTVYQYYNSTSKPDMIFYTSKTKIFFENKLSAPLSKQQMERHLRDVRNAEGRLIFVSQVQTTISESIRKSKFYIKPKNNTHFVWADFESIFNKRYRKGSLNEKILSDFKTGFRSNGMRGRMIVGANDNLYTHGSEAEKLVLETLRGILTEIGFSASKFSNEYTLRVYPRKIREHPLLNPRLHSSGEWLDEHLIEECIITTILINPENKSAIKKTVNLRRLEMMHKGVRYLEHYIPIDNYTLVADIYIPLNFVTIGKKSAVNWRRLRKIWQSVYDLLTEETRE